MPPLLDLEAVAVELAGSPIGQWAEKEAAIGAGKVAQQLGLNLFDAIDVTAAAKLDSGAAELSHTLFPALDQSADFTFKVKSGSELRSVNVHLPPNFNPAKPTPAYFLMDGAQYGDPEGEMLHGYQWAKTADHNGFAAISLVQSEASKLPLPPKFERMFPEHSTWRSAYGLVGASETVNDVSYFRNVLAGVRRAMNLGSVNLVGFCDGGCLAHGLATELPFNGIATVGSTVFKDVEALPLSGARGFFATMKDDMILPESGGAGRSFGRVLVKNGKTRVLQSAPLEQGAVYARANGLVPGETLETTTATERTWVQPGTARVGVRELSLNEGGHNWPGTRFSSLSMQKSEQISPEAAQTLNQRIVEFFGAPRPRFWS